MECERVPQFNDVELDIGIPDDFHVHLRDGCVLQAVAPLTARHFSRGLIMPNLVPPVTTVEAAHAYRERILAATGPDFTPLMSLYLTSDTTVDEIRAAAASPHVVACKLYPANATTNSAAGVKHIDSICAVLQEMERVGLVLCVHGECTNVDMFDREDQFVRTVLPKLLDSYPKLRIVLEHATTAAAAEAVCRAAKEGRLLAATLTPHHVMHNRSALFMGGRMRPDYYCLPILKREEDRQALVKAASGEYSAHFFAGTDSAPHTRDNKLCSVVCAGIFNAPSAIAYYATVFESQGALIKLRAFLSENGAKFYGLPVNKGSRKLYRDKVKLPDVIDVVGGSAIRPLGGGTVVEWRYGASKEEGE